MDFKVVIEKLIAGFSREDVGYALIGGYALGLWGIGRATVDIDFLINNTDLDKVDQIMRRLGYECRHRSENVSQYVSPLQIMGEVDFLHAFRDASIEMLGRAEEKEVFGGAFNINVLKPEDLIGFKVQAIKNDPSREQSDMADIEALLSMHGKRLDWTTIEKYFMLFDMDELYDKLRKQYQ